MTKRVIQPDDQQFKVVCPDGQCRAFHYLQREFAEADAKRHSEARDCGTHERADSPPEWRDPPCPQGEHTVSVVDGEDWLGDNVGPSDVQDREEIERLLTANRDARRIVEVHFDEYGVEPLRGIPLAFSEELLLLHLVFRFIPDGLCIVRMEDVIAVEVGDEEAFESDVLAEEGFVPGPAVPLHSLRGALLAIRAEHGFASVESEDYFGVGELLAVDGDHVDLGVIERDGTRLPSPARFSLDEVLEIRYAARDIVAYAKHGATPINTNLN